MRERFKWLNEPPRWEESDAGLVVVTGEKTDFWRETHYGFIRDDGHFRYRDMSGDFSATLAFQGKYEALYDQAGLMLRLDERNWIKAGIEFVDGQQFLSAVVTRDFSDWSTTPLPGNPEWVCIRCTREDSAVKVEWSESSTEFRMLRLAYLPARGPILVGPMCCSPSRAGFEARFQPLDI